MAHPAKEYMNKLKQAYRRHQLVPFAGAGLSFPLEMPGWGTLIDDICGRFDYERLTEKKGEISELIKEYRYLEAVDELRIAGIGEEDLKISICSAIQRKKQIDIEEHPDNIYKDLAKMNCSKYLTTNYDNYLSDYVGKGPSDITHLYKEFINELDDVIYDGAVYNLHGEYTKPSTIVLSRESYDNLYRDNQDPEGFYFAYHEHLMQTNNVERAFWLYSNKVKSMTASDIANFIEVDLKIRLHDFSGVIESALDIYEKYRDYGETIYAYYASVAYLHYNDFEKARYYLNLYKSNGHVGQQSNSLVQKVEEKLDVLQKRTEVDGGGKANHIKSIAIKAMGRTTEILIPKNESIVIDAPALYALFHIGKEEWLEDNREVFIDSFHLAIQKEKSFVTAYHLPLGFQQNGSPMFLPEGFKTIKIVNDEIMIYTGNIHEV
jgi:hypothetical protein